MTPFVVYSNLKEEDGASGDLFKFVLPEIDVKHEEEDTVLDAEEGQQLTIARQRLTELLAKMTEYDNLRTATLKEQKTLLEAMKEPLAFEAVVSHVNRITSAEACVSKYNVAIKKTKQRVARLKTAILRLETRKQMADEVARAEKEVGLALGAVNAAMEDPMEDELDDAKARLEEREAEAARLKALLKQMRSVDSEPKISKNSKKQSGVQKAQDKSPRKDDEDEDMQLVDDGKGDKGGSVRGGRVGGAGGGPGRVRVTYETMDDDGKTKKKSKSTIDFFFDSGLTFF